MRSHEEWVWINLINSHFFILYWTDRWNNLYGLFRITDKGCHLKIQQDQGVQTDLHILPSYIDKNYSHSIWEYRRRALRLVRELNFFTHIFQDFLFCWVIFWILIFLSRQRSLSARHAAPKQQNRISVPEFTSKLRCQRIEQTKPGKMRKLIQWNSKLSFMDYGDKETRISITYFPSLTTNLLVCNSMTNIYFQVQFVLLYE